MGVILWVEGEQGSIVAQRQRLTDRLQLRTGFVSTFNPAQFEWLSLTARNEGKCQTAGGEEA